MSTCEGIRVRGSTHKGYMYLLAHLWVVGAYGVMQLTFVLSLRSYQFQWSIHCLSSSMGGCAPYTSRVGMLRSSTNTTCHESERERG